MLNPTRRMQHLFYRFEDYKEKTHHNFVVYAIRITAVWWTRITSLSSTHSDDMYIEPTPVTSVVKWRSGIYLRWLNTVLWAASGSCDGECFKLDKQIGRQKCNLVYGRWFLKICSLKFCDMWQNFYFYRILNNENFKMEVEQMNFVTQLMIIIDYLKTSLLKFGQISFK